MSDKTPENDLDATWFAPRIAFLRTGTDSDTVTQYLQQIENITVRLKVKDKPHRDVTILAVSKEREPWVDMTSHIMIVVHIDDDGNRCGPEEEIELMSVEEIGIY